MDPNIESYVRKVVAMVLANNATHPLVPVGVSNRHVHLSPADLETLFGPGHSLQVRNPLSQPGHFAAKETVSLVGPKGVLQNVRVLGPVRSHTQVEVSRADGYVLGIHPDVQESGSTAPSPTLTVVGPCGSVTLTSGVMVALRHLHISPNDAATYGLADGSRVQLKCPGERGIVLANVKVRVGEKFVTEIHLDLDEANAADIRTGDLVELLREGGDTAGT